MQNHEIISGYPCGDGQYVPIEPAELVKLKELSDKGINIEHFIGCDARECGRACEDADEELVREIDFNPSRGPLCGIFKRGVIAVTVEALCQM
jgi:hypothetical protein